VSIINNTVANNDSTATSATAFGGCAQAVPSSRSCPQVAGVYANAGNIGNDFRNNIILGNSAFHWELIPNPANPPASIGNLVRDGFADLGGTGLYTGGNNNGIRDSLLGSVNVMLTPTAPSYCAASRNNTCADPLTIENTLFVNNYRNIPPVFGTSNTQYPPEGTTLANLNAAPAVAAATDEGGNFIDVHYGPLSTVICDTTKGACTGTPFSGTTEVRSDYHLLSTGAQAINLGNNGVAPGDDIDGQARARTSGNPADRGADEFGATALAALPPTIQSIPQQQVLASRTATAPSAFNYQVLASDPNEDQMRYRLIGPLPAGLSINQDTGLVSWIPVVTWGTGNLPATAGCSGNNANTRTCSYAVQVTDGTFPANNTCPAATCASTTLNMQLRRNAGTPTAVANTGNSGLVVNTTGIFTLAAPGVLANDTNPNGQQFPLIAELVADNTVASGKLTLGADGSVQFIPSASWVGTVTFTYRVSNDGVNWSAPATVSLTRDIAVTAARYVNGSWTFTGFGATNGRRIQIVRDRGNQQITPNQNAQRPQVSGGQWSFTRAGGPSFQVNDTATINATTANGGGALFSLAAVPVLSGAALDVHNSVYVQCPGDTNGNAVKDAGETWPAKQVCRHLAAGDGFSVMADGTELYTFGFNDVTGTLPNQTIDKGILNAQFPAPTLEFKEGDTVYLTLTNVGMLKRPDLFDPHSVHFHGFPNAGSVFDGVPESSVAINMGFSFTYYYRIVEPGTFMYHCHVEASEHMQMGMLGNLYVHPVQDGTSKTFGGKTYTKFVYNDADGSTGFDKEYPIQIGSFDSVFHKEHLAVQPLPFAEMHDDYPMLNGRGYPDTVSAEDVPVAVDGDKATSGVLSAGQSSQTVNSIITAAQGQRLLLRISNLNVTQFYTLGTTGGLQMQVIGTGAHILRGPGGAASDSLYYKTGTVTLGGGETADVLIDTTGVAKGRYLLYSTNLNELSNGPQDFGGMMTEIVIQ
jgi:FtsP/CotA-like multicopper oxidase with cupredoxin domain